MMDILVFGTYLVVGLSWLTIFVSRVLRRG